MCGIAGFLNVNLHNITNPRENLVRMTDSIKSRGPDDAGLWNDGIAVGLAHRRLAILDLSAAGHQPMTSVCGRYVLVFNGEIYNHLDLRLELNNIISNENSSLSWRGHSDTETLLKGISIWGVKTTINKCVGMFAFALWDRKEKNLTLCRDRMGEKPLYYGWVGAGSEKTFVFSSDLKAIKKYPCFQNSINRDSICLLMKYGYIPSPHSIYENIYKLDAGKLLTISNTLKEVNIETYWSLSSVALSGCLNPNKLTDTDFVDNLENLLVSSIRQQMLSDVPVGSFLSGGIDSTTITAIMQSQSSFPIKTFTIGFNAKGYDEAKYAKLIAEYIGTEHTELYVSPADALNVIPKLSSIYSEPFSDPSQIPTYLVSQLAKQSVTVTLSGDAGDELFGGYNRYVMTQKIWSKLSYLPLNVRKHFAFALNLLPQKYLIYLINGTSQLLPKSMQIPNLGDKIFKGSIALSSANIHDLYNKLISHCNSQDFVIGGKLPDSESSNYDQFYEELGDVQSMMLLDSLRYLPDDILVKVDRATMAVSLEGRSPFLDHRIVEFAWNLPLHMKLRGGVGKRILRDVLHRYIPSKLMDRPKMGFGVPIDSWLRGPLREWAEAMLDENRIKKEGFLNPKQVRKKWEEHLSGQRNWQYLLWNVLIFQSWLEDECK